MLTPAAPANALWLRLNSIVARMAEAAPRSLWVKV